MEWFNFCITHSIFSHGKWRGFSAVSVIDGICFEILWQNDFPSFLQSLFVLLNHVKEKKRKSNCLAIDFLCLKSWETKTISQLVCNWFLAIVWCLCLKFWDTRNFKIACKDKLSVTGTPVRYCKINVLQAMKQKFCKIKKPKSTISTCNCKSKQKSCRRK